MHIYARRNLEDLLDVLQYDLLDSSSSDSSDDDIDFLVLEMAFAPKRDLGNHLHLDDISEEECEPMFR